MGLMVKFLARTGAVGGLARSLARSYHLCIRNYGKDVDTETVLLYTLIVRYGREAQDDPRGNGATLGSILSNLVEENEITSICGLAIVILVLEAKFFENDIPVQIEFSEVLEEVLLDKRVPSNIALGESFVRGDAMRILHSVMPAIRKVLPYTNR